MAIDLPYYPLTNTGCNDANKVNANFAALIASGVVVDGSGTANKIPKWSDADTLVDSIVSEAGDVLLIAGIPAIRNLIDEDITIPSGYTALMGSVEIATGVTVTINGDAVVL